MYFYAMFGCCSLFISLHLDGYLLEIVERGHIWFACHFQTVTPIPAFFILFSSDFISSLQWHTWISMLRPGSIFSFRSSHMHCISHPAYHALFMWWLFTMLCASFRCCFFGLVLITSCLWGPVLLRPFVSWTRSSSLRDFRQDDHTLEITSIFAC